MIRPLKRLASAIYQHLDTPTSLACYMLMKYGEWDQLATKQADPSNYRDTYHSAVQYAKDSQACDLLRKYELLPTSIDKEEAALASFDSSEMQCFDTNYRLTHLLTGYTPASEALRSILLKASKWISRVLGPLPDRPFRGRFGPGTAFEFRGTAFEPCTLTKCWIAPALTPQAREIFWLATKGFGLWERRRRLGLPCYRPVNQNRFTTVPKDGKTHRGICIEPGGNLWLQLGVGRYLKERLSQMGLYLRPREELSTSPSDFRIVRHDPQAEDIHCELARMGSCTNALATIDLSSASDTVSYELVRALLPPDWFSYLASLRCSRTLIPANRKKNLPARSVLLSKFSSMGNGYTFELQTLIFASLAYACGGRPGIDTFHYGDDTICPVEVSTRLIPLFRLCGFTINAKKTFTTGPFRESCGGDYFLGVYVRPYQLKKHPMFDDGVAAIQRELVERKLPWLPLTDMCKKVLYGPVGYNVFIGPREKWLVYDRSHHKVIRVYDPIPKHWGKDRFSDELHVMAHLGGEPDPYSPIVRGQSDCKTRLVWVP